MTMTDAEVAETISRTDAFIEAVGSAVTEAIAAVNPASPWADEARRGLARISATLPKVDYVTFANLSNLDAAMVNRTSSGLMPLIDLRLMATGAGPSLDYESAAAFLAVFEPMVETARKRRIK